MKKYIVSIAFAFAAGITCVSATENLSEANPKAVETFRKEFAGAQSIQWGQEGEFFKATFILGGNRTIALFSNEGELLGSVRDILYNQLPLSVLTVVEKRFSGAAIYDLRELRNDEGTHYRFTAEMKGKKYNVSINPDGTIQDVERIRK